MWAESRQDIDRLRFRDCANVAPVSRPGPPRNGLCFLGGRLAVVRVFSPALLRHLLRAEPYAPHSPHSKCERIQPQIAPMRLRTKKTWSQHQLAVKLRLEGGGEQGILTFERRRLLIHAAKTALAAALCWWLALRFGLHDGYWGSISAIIVMQSNVGATVTASRDRLLGTFIGALFGFAFSLFGAPPWNYILAFFSPSSSAACWGCATVRAWPASPSPSSCWFPARLRAGAWRSIASLKCCSAS